MQNIPYIKQGYFLSSRSDLVWKTFQISCSYYQEIITGRRGCPPVMCLGNLNWPLQKIPWHTIMLFVCHPKILHKHCLQFLLGVKMALRETEDNAYAKFWGVKQRALWYVMVFSGVVNCKKLFLDCMRTKREQFPVKWLTSGRLAFTIQYVEAMRRHQLKKDMISCNDTRRNTNINKTIDWLIDWFWCIIPLTT